MFAQSADGISRSPSIKGRSLRFASDKARGSSKYLRDLRSIRVESHGVAKVDVVSQGGENEHGRLQGKSEPKIQPWIL